ncbi:MAG TPA: hypothetical protein V6D02_02645 [Candidatus Obscuribacterales bacterium]
MKPELLLSEMAGWSDLEGATPAQAFLPEAATPSAVTATTLAQTFDQDIVGDLGAVFKNFIESGQVWALLIGFVLGYLLRGVTTYK